ncbi:hypothetical protein SAMN05421811_102347 [Nonomuraea wenchangensis]|uniref:Uncharacterized protein n=1 Tax=Nonomuraea wenchangensis TaxID=568860 RepID=A0A1I0CKZ2_9ACTN|nr:hypothetical protein SAMN05421811_102347 [Nonomuraea wenchangensis]
MLPRDVPVIPYRGSCLIRATQRRLKQMYKEFALEAVVWIVPVAVLIGLALLVTA